MVDREAGSHHGEHDIDPVTPLKDSRDNDRHNRGGDRIASVVNEHSER